jgi:ferredoxin
MVTPREVEWNLRFAAGRPIPEDLARDTALSTKRLSIVALACEGCGECVEHCENDALSVVEGKATVDHERCILCGYCTPRGWQSHGLSGFGSGRLPGGRW